MVFAKNQRDQRLGATLVETALVMVPMTMFLFGIFVYGQLLMDWNLLVHAAQEGCRYALANNTDPSINTNVQAIVSNYMIGKSNSLTNITVTISGSHQGFAIPVNNLNPGDLITVTISGNYRFPNIVPLLPLPSALSLSSSATMICEGGP
jgi:Flp pilus assembly protein TadG